MVKIAIVLTLAALVYASEYVHPVPSHNLVIQDRNNSVKSAGIFGLDKANQILSFSNKTYNPLAIYTTSTINENENFGQLIPEKNTIEEEQPNESEPEHKAGDSRAEDHHTNQNQNQNQNSNKKVLGSSPDPKVPYRFRISSKALVSTVGNTHNLFMSENKRPSTVNRTTSNSREKHFRPDFASIHHNRDTSLASSTASNWALIMLVGALLVEGIL